MRYSKPGTLHDFVVSSFVGRPSQFTYKISDRSVMLKRLVCINLSVRALHISLMEISPYLTRNTLPEIPPFISQYIFSAYFK